jgi:hypothetical protein
MLFNPDDLEILNSFINARRREQTAPETPGAFLVRTGRHFLGG